MFEKMYNKSISEVKPDRELIESTKKMMQDELDSKKFITNVSFYKYASIAACALVVISTFMLYPRNVMQDLSSGSVSDPNNNFIAEDNSCFEGATMNKDSSFQVQNVSPKYSNSFDSFVTTNGDIGALANNSAPIKNSNPFFNWIKGIIQWFYELLF